MKKELEQEKLALAKETAKQVAKSSGATENIQQEVPHLLAVNGVYFRCPLVSEEVLDRETWYEKLEEFFSTQLSEDEAGLSACLIIQSCNYGADRIKYCVDTLCKYLDNIRNNPSEVKYWKIRMSNKIFQVN